MKRLIEIFFGSNATPSSSVTPRCDEPVTSQEQDLSAMARAMGRKGGKKRAQNAKRVEPAEALKARIAEEPPK